MEGEKKAWDDSRFMQLLEELGGALEEGQEDYDDGIYGSALEKMSEEGFDDPDEEETFSMGLDMDDPDNPDPDFEADPEWALSALAEQLPALKFLLGEQGEDGGYDVKVSGKPDDMSKWRSWHASAADGEPDDSVFGEGFELKSPEKDAGYWKRKYRDLLSEVIEAGEEPDPEEPTDSMSHIAELMGSFKY